MAGGFDGIGVKVLLPRTSIDTKLKFVKGGLDRSLKKEANVLIFMLWITDIST